jgi:two-component system, chemotaxis family, chemotaxis protein CheY
MPHRITVVDDSPEIRSLFADVLESGTELTLLGSPVSHEDIERSHPDVLVIDLRLGTDDLPGWEIVRHLRSHPHLESLPIIVCSGALEQLGDRADVRAGSGPTYLLPKPFSVDDLEAVMSDALDRPSAVHAARPPSTSASAFADDPYGWFDLLGAAAGSPAWEALIGAAQPAAWSRVPGRAWRLMRTSVGVEVRPELLTPFLRFGDQPMVTAIGLGPDVAVELTTLAGRWVDRFAIGTFDVGALGRAMLDERKLPHDNLPRLFPPVTGVTREAGMAAIRIGGHQAGREALRV